MDINLDEGVLQQAVIDCTNKAVQSAMTSYEIEKVIRDKVVESVLSSAIVETVASAIADTDMRALHVALSSELSRTVTSAATRLLREAMINVLISMRGLADYERDKIAAARQEIEASLLKE